MIQINDGDSAILAAAKIVDATRTVTNALTDKVTEVDQFDINEIREISDYLFDYWRNNLTSESEEDDTPRPRAGFSRGVAASRVYHR